MSHGSAPRPCPDASVVAAYVEGALDPESRRDVELHVADCAECPMVIAEAARFLQGDGERDADDEPRRQRWWLFAAAAALAAVCLPALIGRVEAWRDPLRKTKTIAAGLPARTIEGRLADFEYAPLSAPRSAAKTDQTIALRAEAERLNEQAEESARSRHARGVARLLTGDADGAVTELSAAVRLEPDRAVFWNDLAAAQLDRKSFAEALVAADHATALLPSFTAAHFNRGLCLESLGRPTDAVRAYRRARDLDPRSPWNLEIDARIARLQE